MHILKSWFYSDLKVKDDKCFLCNKPARFEDLHSASIYDIDVKVHRCAIELEGTAFLAKLEYSMERLYTKVEV